MSLALCIILLILVRGINERFVFRSASMGMPHPWVFLEDKTLYHLLGVGFREKNILHGSIILCVQHTAPLSFF